MRGHLHQAVDFAGKAHQAKTLFTIFPQIRDFVKMNQKFLQDKIIFSYFFPKLPNRIAMSINKTEGNILAKRRFVLSPIIPIK